jgi:HK97 family phage prohead protease
MKDNKFLTFGFELKEVDEKSGLFEGYAAAFNNIDYGFDMIIPGAFKKTVKESKGKFPILADHDPRKQIGWNLEAEEDSYGLKVKGQLMVDEIVLAKERHALMKKALALKTKSGLSIGYRATKWEMDEDKTSMQRYRKLKEIQLFEYSLVTFPMNDQAMATAAKEFDLLMQEKNHTEQELVEKFLAKMRENGFNDLAIKSALESAAAQIIKPLDLEHLFDQGLKSLKTSLQE